MTSYHSNFRSSDDRWREHDDNLSNTLMRRSVNESERLSHHEAAHAFAVLAFGGAVRRATIQPTKTSYGNFVAHVELERGIAKLEDEIVVRLAGEAYDFIHYNFEHWGETNDGRVAWNCALRMVGDVEGTADEHFKRGWLKACDLVTIYKRAIDRFAAYIYKHGEVSGDELRVIFRAAVPAVPEDGGQSKAGASAAFNSPGRPKRKKKTDLEDLDQDELDETDECQTNDEIEEEDILIEAGPDEDENSVESNINNPSVKKEETKTSKARRKVRGRGQLLLANRRPDWRSNLRIG